VGGGVRRGRVARGGGREAPADAADGAQRARPPRAGPGAVLPVQHHEPGPRRRRQPGARPRRHHGHRGARPGAAGPRRRAARPQPPRAPAARLRLARAAAGLCTSVRALPSLSLDRFIHGLLAETSLRLIFFFSFQPWKEEDGGGALPQSPGGVCGGGAKDGQSSARDKVLPFEFRALEVCLEFSCKSLEHEVTPCVLSSCSRPLQGSSSQALSHAVWNLRVRLFRPAHWRRRRTQRWMSSAPTSALSTLSV
jgi:hypothetical protein